MNQRDERKLDVLSGIDDDIIEKHTLKRFELLSAMKPKRQGKRLAVSVIALAAALCLLLATVVVLLIPRDPGSHLPPVGSESETSPVIPDKRVPIYQGMTISSEIDTPDAELKLAYPDGMVPLGAMGGGMDLRSLSEITPYAESESETAEAKTLPHDNGNHTGHKKPMGEVAKDLLKVEGAAEEIYYANAGQDIYITVHVSNPDNYEILSFTLNGKVYSSYMFENGSDMENLILKYNVGDAEGVVEYTIDAIKYVDGTEIKDVIMEGDRTVRCGIYSDRQPEATVTNAVVGINRLSFAVTLTDPLGLIADCNGVVMAVITEDNRVVASQALTVGEAVTVTFDGLATDTVYTYGVVAKYDTLDGDGIKPVSLYEQEIRTQSVVAFDNVSVTAEGVTFGYAWNPDFEGKTLSALTLWKDGAKVRELATDATAVEGLLSDTTYTLSMTYVNGGQTETVSLELHTAAKTVPTLTLTAGDITQSSVGFTTTYTDPDAVGGITKVELLHGEDEPVAVDVATRTFTDLLSDNSYTVRVTATYDLNDGTGAHEIVETLELHTVAKTAPEVTITSVRTTRYTLTGDYTVTDTDGTLLSHKVELYQGETLISTNGANEISFADLAHYTDYTLRITYTYDLSDGRGEQTETVERTVRTQPYLDVTAVILRSAASVKEGDTISLQVDLANPLAARIESLVINGETYAVANVTTAGRVMVSIPNDGRFKGGDTVLTVEKVNMTLNGETFSVAAETVCSANVFVEVDLKMVSVSFANQDLEPVRDLALGEEAYLLFTVSNPAGHEITSLEFGFRFNSEDSQTLTLAGNRLQKVSEEQYAYSLGIMESVGTVNVWWTSTAYADRADTPDVSINSVCCVLTSREVKYISTPEQLMNVDDWYYYQLTCDIDLSGKEWKNVNLYGVLDGNGYTVRNLSCTASVGGDYGLFSEANGTIRDLHVENFLFVINITESEYVYYGALVGRSLKSLTVERCSVDANTVVSIKMNGRTVNAGGLVGYGVSVQITDCSNASSILISGEENRSYKANAGGIIGICNIGSVRGCLFTGRIAVSDSLYDLRLYGGIAGNASVVVEDCLNAGSLRNAEGMSWRYEITGGSSGTGEKIINCYVSEDDRPWQNYTVEGVSMEQMSDPAFYTDVLGWDETVWDIGDPDAEAGKYPTLRQKG